MSDEDPTGRRAIAHHSSRLRAALARAGRSHDPLVRLEAPAIAGEALDALTTAVDRLNDVLDEARSRRDRLDGARTASMPTRRH